MNLRKKFIELRERFDLEERKLEQESKKTIKSSFRIGEKIQVIHKSVVFRNLPTRTDTAHLKEVKNERIIIVKKEEGFPQNIPFRDIKEIISVE